MPTTPSNNASEKKHPTDAFVKLLNRHGYPFQFACLEAAKRTQSWLFEATEFPVSVSGPGTRIDFILKGKSSPIYLLVECKRANPRFNDWCFASFSLVRRNRAYEHIFAEWVKLSAGGATASARAATFSVGGFFHIGLEVKGKSKGDPTGSAKREIEHAASQACRGLNGMVSFWANHRTLRKGGDSVVLIPVIFTTANLWGLAGDLGSATSLTTGEIDRSAMDRLQPQDWVFYQYHLSPGIKHALPSGITLEELAPILDSEYIRTIPIVSAGSIEKFLRSFATLEPGDFHDIR